MHVRILSFELCDRCHRGICIAQGMFPVLVILAFQFRNGWRERYGVYPRSSPSFVNQRWMLQEPGLHCIECLVLPACARIPVQCPSFDKIEQNQTLVT